MNQVSEKPSRWLRFILPIMVLGIGALVAFWLLQTGPEAKPKPKTRNALLVEVVPVTFAPQPTMVAAMGVVKPSRMVEVKPQVGGEIVGMHPAFVPGSHFRAGEQLIKIDPADTLLAIQQLKGDVARAEAEIVLEQGKKLVALREYQLLGEVVSPEEKALMLREPQLASLQAARDSAAARLEQARLNLERTAVTVPFSALVQERKVNLGAQVSTATTLATLVGSDAYWIEVSVPVSQLRWLQIPQRETETGSAARVYDEAAWGATGSRVGSVLRMAPGLEQQGRMARLLVKIDDPLALLPHNSGQPRLMLDAYVRVEIVGAVLPSVVTLARKDLHDDDSVWLMSSEDQLEIRKVEVAFRGRDTVQVTSGLAEGERLILSPLPAPVPGMLLRLAEPTSASAAGSRSAEAEQEKTKEEGRRP